MKGPSLISVVYVCHCVYDGCGLGDQMACGDIVCMMGVVWSIRWPLGLPKNCKFVHDLSYFGTSEMLAFF